MINPPPVERDASLMGRSDATESAQELKGLPQVQGPRAAMESTDLFKGCKTVEIRHNGAIYRLQATRLGKLILTK